MLNRLPIQSLFIDNQDAAIDLVELGFSPTGLDYNFLDR